MKIKFNYKNIVIFSFTLLSSLLIFRELISGKIRGVLFELFAFFLLTWFILIIDKLLKLKLSNFIYYLFYTMLFINLFLGTILNFSSTSIFIDNLFNLINGIVFFIIGIYLIYRIDNIGYMKFSVLYTFALFCALSLTLVYRLSSFILFGGANGYIITRLVARMVYSVFASLLVSVFLIFDYSYYKSKYLEKLFQLF